MPSLILWDIDYTLLDPHRDARARLAHLWTEIVQPVLTEAQSYLPQIQPVLDIAQLRPVLFSALDHEESCCAGLSAIILEVAFGGAVAKWLPIHDEIFYAITGVNQSFQPELWEMMQDIPAQGEWLYPEVLAGVQAAQAAGCDQAIMTHRETLAAGHPLRDYFPANRVFTREQGDKTNELGRAMLLDALATQREIIAQETVMIGDMPQDALLAGDLGYGFILAAYGHRNYRNRPQDYAKALARLKQYQVTESVENLKQIIASLRA